MTAEEITEVGVGYKALAAAILHHAAWDIQHWNEKRSWDRSPVCQLYCAVAGIAPHAFMRQLDQLSQLPKSVRKPVCKGEENPWCTPDEYAKKVREARYRLKCRKSL